MNLTLYRQIRIFAPSELPPELWAQALIKEVITPVVRAIDLDWYWFTRYIDNAEGDIDDCEFAKLPADFLWLNKWHRSIRFRLEANKEAESLIQTFVEDNGYWSSGFIDFDPETLCCGTKLKSSMKLYHLAAKTIIENGDSNWYKIVHVIGNMGGCRV